MNSILGRAFIAIGREEGMEECATHLVTKLATRRFGALPEATLAALEDLDYLQLEALTDWGEDGLVEGL